MGQTTTGKLSEERVLDELWSHGLEAYKVIPDHEIDIIAYFPSFPQKTVKIQVKGRNPKHDPNLRWFQLRVRVSELDVASGRGLDLNQTWISKINLVDFFVFDAIKLDEMWVFPKEVVFDVIKDNEKKYSTRQDNIFTYSEPFKQKQKEMNLDIEVDEVKLTEKYGGYLNNFKLILDLLQS